MILLEGDKAFADIGQVVIPARILDPAEYGVREFNEEARKLILHELTHSAIQDNERALPRFEPFPGMVILKAPSSRWALLVSEMEADMYAGSSFRQALLDVTQPGRYGILVNPDDLFGLGWRSLDDGAILNKMGCGDSSLEWDYPFVFGSLP